MNFLLEKSTKGIITFLIITSISLTTLLLLPFLLVITPFCFALALYYLLLPKHRTWMKKPSLQDIKNAKTESPMLYVTVIFIVTILFFIQGLVLYHFVR